MKLLLMNCIIFENWNKISDIVITATLYGKMLSRVKYLYDGKMVSRVKYLFDGKMVSRVKYLFDGKMVSKVKYLFHGKMVSKVKYLFDEKMVSRVKYLYIVGARSKYILRLHLDMSLPTILHLLLNKKA